MARTPKKNRVVRSAYKIHSWLGVCAGVLFLVMALTGSLLVFKPEITRLTMEGVPIQPRAQPLALDALAANLRAHAPSASIAGIVFPIDAYGKRDYHYPYQISMVLGDGSNEQWLVNAFTGALLRPPAFDVVQFLRDIHVRLLLNAPGWLRDTAHIFVGVLGLILMTSIVTGLIVHGRHLVRDLFRFRSARSRRVLLSDLHKQAAVWGLIFYALMGLTGAFMGLKTLWWLVQPVDMSVSAELAPGFRMASLETLINAARRAIPAAEPLELILPNYQGDPVTVVMRNDNPLIHHWSSKVELDPQTGALRNSYDAAQAGFWARAYFMVEPLHFGYYGGLPVRVLYGVLGLALACLPITGLMIWLSHLRKPRPARQKPRTLAVENAPADSSGIIQ